MSSAQLHHAVGFSRIVSLDDNKTRPGTRACSSRYTVVDAKHIAFKVADDPAAIRQLIQAGSFWRHDSGLRQAP